MKTVKCPPLPYKDEDIKYKVYWLRKPHCEEAKLVYDVYHNKCYVCKHDKLQGIKYNFIVMDEEI